MIGKLKQCIANTTGRDGLTFTLEANLDEDFGLDSLEYLFVIHAIETKWNIEIPDRAAAGFETFGDLVNWMEAAGCG